MKNVSRGYTLIELLVALGIFTIVVVTASAAYLSFISYNRQAQTTATVINSLSFVIDAMAREIRTGNSYQCQGSSCSSSGESQLTFVDASGCTIRYRISGSALARSVLSGSGRTTVIDAATTDQSIVMTSLLFYVRGTSNGDDIQPMVTAVIGGYACVPNTDCTGSGRVPFQLQTGATQRLPDV